MFRIVKLPAVEIGYPVFVEDGSGAFGAVRRIGVGGRPDLLVHVEGAGEHVIPYEAIEKVVAKKVVVRLERLGEEIRRASAHAYDREDFPPPGGEVELVPAPPDEDDAQDDSWAPRWDGPHPTEASR